MQEVQSNSPLELSKEQTNKYPWLPVEAWNGFVVMRNKKKKPMTDRARELILRTLEKLHAGGHDIAAILDKSTINSWTDIYLPNLPKAGNSFQSRNDRSGAAAAVFGHVNPSPNGELIDVD
jgi:hypothetical protein